MNVYYFQADFGFKEPREGKLSKNNSENRAKINSVKAKQKAKAKVKRDAGDAIGALKHDAIADGASPNGIGKEYAQEIEQYAKAQRVKATPAPKMGTPNIPRTQTPSVKTGRNRAVGLGLLAGVATASTGYGVYLYNKGKSKKDERSN
jgi:hypothetical protein